MTDHKSLEIRVEQKYTEHSQELIGKCKNINLDV